MYRQSAASNFGGATALDQPTSGVSQGWFQATLTSLTTSGTAYSTIASAGNTAIMYKSTETDTNNLPLCYDGMLAQIFQNQGSAGTAGVKAMTPLVVQPAAANRSLASSDVDGLLETMYLSAHADPDVIFVSVKDHRPFSAMIAQASSYHINVDNGPRQGDLTVGGRATKFINQTTGKVLDIVMLPYLTQGTIVIGSFSIPFPVSAIDKPVFRMEVNQERWAQELPPDQSHQTQWQYNAFVNETMVNQYLGGWAAISGVKIN
jgi:hypothetical protein